jgi:hypothetical protein
MIPLSEELCNAPAPKRKGVHCDNPAGHPPLGPEGDHSAGLPSGWRYGWFVQEDLPSDIGTQIMYSMDHPEQRRFQPDQAQRAFCETCDTAVFRVGTGRWYHGHGGKEAHVPVVAWTTVDQRPRGALGRAMQTTQVAQAMNDAITCVKCGQAWLIHNEWVVSLSTPPDCDHTLETDQISDGYHTFAELYADRSALLMLTTWNIDDELTWRSLRHDDGTMFPGQFIVGIHLPDAPITYHVPIELWDDFDHCRTVGRAPIWDGHTPADVVQRIRDSVTRERD